MKGRDKEADLIVHPDDYIRCPKCSVDMKLINLAKHFRKKHSLQSIPPDGLLLISALERARKALNSGDGRINEFIKCPECASVLKVRNIKRHFRIKHNASEITPQLAVLLEKSKAKKRIRPKSKSKKVHGPLPDHKMTKADAHELSVALKELESRSDKIIGRYLKNNPATEEIGKFGVPQDKYRHGFYGSKSMEFDSWSKNIK